MASERISRIEDERVRQGKKKGDREKKKRFKDSSTVAGDSY